MPRIIAGTERRVEAHVGVLELNGHAPVRVLAESDLAEERDVFAERAGAEDIQFLRELQVVMDRRHRTIFIERGRVDFAELDVDGERHGAGDIGRPDGLRPQPLIRGGPKADRLLLDHVLRLARQAVAA
jgi:hypothetical protein